MAEQNALHVQEASDISEKYENPLEKPETSYIDSFVILKERIRHHYEICSEYYLNLWGEHIHHGYFTHPNQTKEDAQIQLINLLLSRSQLAKGTSVLDVGCGIGGTSRYLAKTLNCHVTGITISPTQVRLARQLTLKETNSPPEPDSQATTTTPLLYHNGTVTFLELDAEKMGDNFSTTTNLNPNAPFTTIWITEALSHLPSKPLFFQNAHALLPASGGKLVIADWFKAAHLSPLQETADIKPIEDGMLLPPLCTQTDYLKLATEAGFEVFAEPMDISAQVARTWDISWGLIQSPALWGLALAQGRDGLAFLQAFRAMRRGYANGTFRYGVLVFRKP